MKPSRKYFAVIFLICCTALLVHGCAVSKAKNKTTADLTDLKKADSGTVKLSENESKTNAAWWKETLLFARPKDTIEKQPIYYNTTNPIQIIREGGTMVIDTKQKNLDSSWKATVDSLRNIVAGTQTTKETTVLNFWQILAICFGVIILIVAVILIPKPKIQL